MTTKTLQVEHHLELQTLCGISFWAGTVSKLYQLYMCQEKEPQRSLTSGLRNFYLYNWFLCDLYKQLHTRHIELTYTLTNLGHDIDHTIIAPLRSSLYVIYSVLLFMCESELRHLIHFLILNACSRDLIY